MVARLVFDRYPCLSADNLGTLWDIPFYLIIREG